MDVHDEQADIIEAPVVTSNPTGSATLEPIITPCSEQVTLRADLNQLITPLMYFAQIIFTIRALIFRTCSPLTQHQLD